MTIDYQIKLISFPTGKVREAVVSNEDGTFTIFIDESLSQEQQYQRFLHAYEHLTGNDFEKENDDEIKQDTQNTFFRNLCAI